MVKIKLKKGDTVKVLTGKDKGKVGEILQVLPQASKAVVSGIAEVTKHQKPGRNSQGGIVKKNMPIDISNLAFYDENAKTISKIGYRINDKGEKVRYAKKSGENV